MLSLCLIGASQAHAKALNEERARLIVLTDVGNEPDDSESLVRLLVYSNEIEIEGLVASTSRHLPRGSHPEIIERQVAAYSQVVTNLRANDPNYPDAATLRSLVRAGSQTYGMTGVGAGRDTPGSNLIIKVVDAPDPRPVWIAAWGGAADLAQALWNVRANRTPAALARFVAKLRVYSISDQDDAGPWARAYFPELFWVTSIHGFTRYPLGTWQGISAPLPGADSTSVSREWLEKNIRATSALGAAYPLPAYIMEGDTPSFLNLVPNGLSQPERPDWGGWGGRYDRLSETLGLWTSTVDAVKGTDGKGYMTPQATIWRWRQDFQNDFAARMQWSSTSKYEAANHPPMAQLNGKEGNEPVEISGCPGVPISLSAAGSRDPDGNALSYSWSQYREASGLFSPSVTLSASAGERTTVTIGSTAHTDQFDPPEAYRVHILLTVRDSGTPQLTRYRRAIINVPGATHTQQREACHVEAIPPQH